LVVLSELRPILIDLSEFTLCASLFQDAFDHYQGLYPSGIPDVTVSDTAQVPTSSGSSSGPIQCFDMLDILVLVDLYNTPALAAHENAVTTIRRGCRWLQGRGDQKFWDLCEDDREYDPPGANARVGGVQPGRYPLDVNARQRLAVGRIKIGDFEEGKVSTSHCPRPGSHFDSLELNNEDQLHASIVLSHDVMDYAPLFAEIADAYFDKDVYADAKPIYELLGADAGVRLPI
jgi:general transcription factor 3C polypeptide 3 (transcription factor C subunit 4)